MAFALKANPWTAEPFPNPYSQKWTGDGAFYGNLGEILAPWKELSI